MAVDSVIEPKDPAQEPARFSRRVQITDHDTAFSMAQQETDALAAMMGSDSRRIDVLVNDVGHIKGEMSHSRETQQTIVKGVDELKTAMAVLVRHEVVMEQHGSSVAAVKAEQKAQDDRLHVLERKAPGWDETRAWVVRAGLMVVAAVAIALLALVIRK